MVRVTAFLPLASSALLPPIAANRHESYAASVHTKRDLLTCDQTYGANWTQCGNIDSTFCYNPSEGQSCCVQDAGYCDAGSWCAPVAGFCCLDSEDLGTCAQAAGFDVPASLSSAGLVSSTTLSTKTTTRSTTFTEPYTTTTSTTESNSAASSVVSEQEQLPTATGFGSGLTWTSVYPEAPATAHNNGSSSTNSTGLAVPSPTYVQISDGMRAQWTFVWMTAAMGVVGVFMATC